MGKASLYGEHFPEDVHDYRVDRHGFQIFLFGEDKSLHADDETPVEPGIEFQMANRLIINIAMLSDIDSEKPILVHMKTCGGIWEEGMAIYDAICACPNPVTILSYTHARSMSSIILQAADRRVLMPNSYFMFHMGSLTFNGTFKGTVTGVNWTDRVMTRTMLKIYAERLAEGPKFRGKTQRAIESELVRFMDRKEDVFLSAREAVRWGFADAVFNFNWNTLRARSVR